MQSPVLTVYKLNTYLTYRRVLSWAINMDTGELCVHYLNNSDAEITVTHDDWVEIKLVR